MSRLAICAVLVFLLSACSSGTPVVFQKASEHQLDNVVLSGRGFEASLGVVAPGQSITAQIYPSGESGLAVTFTANGRGFSYKPQDYFEGGGSYKLSSTVNRNLTVVVHSETQL